jgi:hypothetical protein
LRGKRYKAKDASKLVKQLNSEDTDEQFAATCALRGLLSPSSEDIRDGRIGSIVWEAPSAVVANGLAAFLSSSNPALVYEACGALGALSDCGWEESLRVFQVGAVSKFIELLSHPHLQVCQQVMEILGKLSREYAQPRDTVLASDAVRVVAYRLTSGRPPSVEFTRAAATMAAGLVANTKRCAACRQTLPRNNAGGGFAKEACRGCSVCH